MRRVLPPEALAFDEDADELARIVCTHKWWRWLDCDRCRETVGLCGEKLCHDCGATFGVAGLRVVGAGC